MAQDLLVELHRRGIKLRLADGRLDVLAPAGSLTPELREELRRQRDTLITLLRRAGTSEDLPPDLTPQPGQRHEPFALTDMQHAYWVGRNTGVELGGVFTHSYFEFERDGLDAERLNRSLLKVIARHDMLRALVQPDGKQRVLADVPAYEIAVADLSELDAAARDAELAKLRAEMSHQSLPPDRWPLFEIRASRISGERLRLHINIDNLIIDGVSLYLLFGDWRRFYENPDWAPEPLQLSYRDYVLAEEAQRAGGRYTSAEEYWLRRLDELPPAPELPLATQPARLSRPEFSVRRGYLPRWQWDRIKKAAKKRGLTPSTVLMTAFADVLRLWSRQPDCTLNLTLFNRPPLHPEIDQIIGDFTSVTLLAAQTQPDDSFSMRAERLNQQLMRDLEHLSFSGVRVLQERARRLRGAPGAAMPVVFTSGLAVSSGDEQASDMAESRRFLGDLLYTICETPQVWLDHQVSEEQGEMVHLWNAVEALFPGRLLDDMFSRYCGVLDQLSQDEAAWDERRSLVSLPQWQVEERAQANDTKARTPDRTLCELVEAQAGHRPDELAVIASDGDRTYRDIVADARRLARRLISLGAAPGHLVGVVLDKGCDQVASVIGVTMSGGAYLPIDPEWPEARRAQLLAQGGTRVVVTAPGLRDELTWPQDIRLVTLADPEVRGADPGPLDSAPSTADLAYVIFTSGSTGQPKGVMIDHRGAANTIQDINERFQVGPGDRVLALSALSFDLSVYDIFGTLAAGGAVVMPTPASAHDPAHWTELMERHGVTVWNSVPALMQAWLEARGPGDSLPGAGLRLVLLSGDWIQVALPDSIRAHIPDTQVISLGGATEASIWSVWYPIGKVPPEWIRIPYGKPLANQSLYVYDELLEPCPVWTSGEIYIGGIGVAKGYWADPERTAERFIVHPRTNERLYRTGDMGRYLPGGDIEFLGRQDFQVKLNGYRIELGEIAAVLRRQPSVSEALVNVDSNPATGRRQLVAYIVPAAAAPGAATQDPAADAAADRPPPDPAALRDALGNLLPDYLVPHHYLVVDRIPLSANGKVNPSALPKPWGAPAPDDQVGPRGDMEQKLLEIWRDTLGREDFGVEDNLFELGGDSLHAVRILGRVREELGIEAEDGLQWIFDSPTIAELTVTLRNLAES